MNAESGQIEGITSFTPSDGGVGPAMARLAGRQHGVVSRRQLFRLGLSPRTIGRSLARGRLHRVHRGVYAVGHESLSPDGRWLAAVLAAGPEAVLSHRSAAALWGIRPAHGSRIDVTVPAGGRHSRPGIAIHVTGQLPDHDRAQLAEIPVTSLARTLLDLGGLIPMRQLSSAFEQADRLGLLDLREVEDVCRRGAGRRGLGALLKVVDEHRGPTPVTRSELERAFLELCDAHRLPRPQVNVRLPRPQVNVPVAGFEVDAVWPQSKLIVELDGFAFHRTRAAFERDRRRDAALQLAGYRVLRFTHRMLADEPGGIAATVGTALDQG